MSDLLAGLVQPTDDEPRRRRASEPRKPRATGAGQAKRKPPSPPNRVDPGWVHKTAAALILRALADHGGDVGTVDEEFLQNVPGMEDGPEPAVLLARVIAHIAHRIPGLRRIERRLEGTEGKAGFGSDVFALALQLYFRNRDIIATGVTQYRQAREAERTVKADTAKSASNGGNLA